MTSEKHISVWRNCLNFIGQNLDHKQFNLWFRPIKPVSLVESTLTVEVPSEFFREYLEGAYLDLLKAALKKELGVGAKLVYVVTPVKQQPYFFRIFRIGLRIDKEHYQEEDSSTSSE